MVIVMKPYLVKVWIPLDPDQLRQVEEAVALRADWRVADLLRVWAAAGVYDELKRLVQESENVDGVR